MGISLLYKIKNLHNIKVEKKKNPVRPRSMQLFLIVKRIPAPRPAPQKKLITRLHTLEQVHKPTNKNNITNPGTSRPIPPPPPPLIFEPLLAVSSTMAMKASTAPASSIGLRQVNCASGCCKTFAKGIVPFAEVTGQKTVRIVVIQGPMSSPKFRVALN